MKRVCAVAVLALVLGGNAWAHDGQEGQEGRPHTHWYLEMDTTWYAGASFGPSTFNDWSSIAGSPNPDASFTSRAEDDSDTGLRVFAGVDFWRYFALELGYADYGEATLQWQNDGSGPNWAPGPVTEAVKLKAFDLELLGKLPLAENLSLFGKAGWVQLDDEDPADRNSSVLRLFRF